MCLSRLASTGAPEAAEFVGNGLLTGYEGVSSVSASTMFRTDFALSRNSKNVRRSGAGLIVIGSFDRTAVLTASECFAGMLLYDRDKRWVRPWGTVGSFSKAWESIRMRRQIALIACSAIFGFMTLSSPVVAQQKTAKECREEWRANKAANQANGVTEKAYVAQCRGGAAPATTTEAPAAPPVAAPEPKEAVAGQKTAKACREEWRANKAANQANGVTEKAYVAQCRGGSTPAQTTAAPPPRRLLPRADVRRRDKRLQGNAGKSGEPTRQRIKPMASPKRLTSLNAVAALRPLKPLPPRSNRRLLPAPAPAAPPPAPTAAAPSARPAPPPPATAGPAASVPENPVGANEFSTEAQAKARCPADTVVWVNLTSKVYHFSGTRSYGNTKRGTYMCEHDTAAAGMRAAKNETHP